MAPAPGPIDISSYLIDPPSLAEPELIDWHRLFGIGQPVELEIGSGKGLFLINAATRDVRCNFLGIELARKYAKLAAERLARRNLTNARVWRGDARFVLGRLVPAASLRAVHVYFPDPWWKKRHKKRRVFTDVLVTQIARTLQPGGQLFIASDVEEYFTLMRALIAASDHFEENVDPWPGEAGESADYLTNFERKYRIEGLRDLPRAIHVSLTGRLLGNVALEACEGL